MRARFWGVRGSIPTPLTPSEVEAKVVAMAEEVVRAGVRDPEKVSTYLREHHSMMVRGTVGGNTTCMSVEWKQGLIIFDAGTGIRELGRVLMDGPFGRGKGEVYILMSHTHWDHIMGFPYFAPLFQKNLIHIWGCHEGIERRLRGQQAPDYFPVPLDIYPAQIDFQQVEPEKQYELPGGVKVTPKKLNHPGDSYGYRVERNSSVIVFATDSEYKRNNGDQHDALIEFFKDADVLVFDSQYTLEESMIKEDWGHSTAVIGVDMAIQAGVKRLALFHHEPNYPDKFVFELMQKARRYKNLNYPDVQLDIFVAMEQMEIIF